MGTVWFSETIKKGVAEKIILMDKVGGWVIQWGKISGIWNGEEKRESLQGNSLFKETL